MKTVFLRVLEAEDKATALLEAVLEPGRAQGQQRFEVDVRTFGMVPRSPFAYWVSDHIRRVFTDVAQFETDERTATRGASTCDDFRYVRLWIEALTGRKSPFRWVPFTKGGRFARFYSPLPTVVDWDTRRFTFRGFVGRPGRWLERPEAADKYFRPAITWPLRGITFSAQVVPRGCIFSVGGKVAIIPTTEIGALLGLFNSAAFDAFVRLYAGKVGGVQYEVGLIQTLPVPHLTQDAIARLEILAFRGWSLKRCLHTRLEMTHAFTLPALLQVGGAEFAARVAAWSKYVRDLEAQLAAIQAEIDERCFTLYGIDEVDRRIITEGFGSRSSEEPEVGGTDEAEEDDGGEESDKNDSAADAASLVAELVSWTVGTAFGRFDMRLATGARPIPREPEPFDPLPVCSSGMLTDGEGLPLARPPVGYLLNFPESGVLVDDPGHVQDLTAAIRAVFDAVFGADADRWWNDVAALLDPKDHELRGWLTSGFFEYHLKRYSKSRRKAPIIWQLGVPSGRYSVWLYAHRLTQDSFFQLQNDVVGPKLSHEERQLTNLMQNAGDTPSASERKEIAAQEVIVDELRAMLDEIRRVAPLWNPNLDDGVVLTMAPLWRLVPQHKPWQKELKGKWNEPADGKYDWAHLAMHLWPERVVPKCATDRSLAIAHGLEDIFWVEDSNGKWKVRSTPVRPLDEIVGERSSLAVKSALKNLIEAPGTVTNKGSAHARSRR